MLKRAPPSDQRQRRGDCKIGAPEMSPRHDGISGRVVPKAHKGRGLKEMRADARGRSENLTFKAEFLFHRLKEVPEKELRSVGACRI